MHSLEIFFDCSSPWTYLAFENIQPLAERYSLEIIWRPILVGGIFNTSNPSVYETRENPVPAKAAYYQKDLQDWAAFTGITIGQPPVFPVNSVNAMRGAFVAIEEDCLVPYVRRVFHRYWGELEDISQEEVLRDIVIACGIVPETFFERISSQDYKDQLRHTTQELVDRGGFGSPTMFLNGTDMYFGNDRLVLIEAKLAAEANA